MRITRFPGLSEFQFLGCVSAFVDALTGESNAAALALRRLENRSKGSAFAHEMALDRHRYGALIVLDRWATVIGAFGPRVAHPVAAEAAGRIDAAETILARVNQLVDSVEAYGSEVVEAAIAGWQSLNVVFEPERAEAVRSAKLGPMLPEEYREARRIFLEDLSAR